MSLINVNDVSPEYNSIYNNIGILFTETGKFEKAADYLNLSYKIRLKLGDSILIAQSLVNLGTLERDRGRQDTALNYYKKGFTVFRLATPNQMHLKPVCISEFYMNIRKNTAKQSKSLRKYSYSKTPGIMV